MGSQTKVFQQLLVVVSNATRRGGRVQARRVGAGRHEVGREAEAFEKTAMLLRPKIKAIVIKD
jgi:hypothetical protein